MSAASGMAPPPLLRLAVAGATGRMGRAVIRIALESGKWELVGACTSPNNSALGQDAGTQAGTVVAGVALTADVESSLLGADVVIDFALPAAFQRLVRAATRAGVPLVSGTTGVVDAAVLDDAATQIPVLWAPNMSLGIVVLTDLVTQAVQQLGSGFDVEITEVHHRGKVDAPSGTARRLAEAAAQAQDLCTVHGRSGSPGPRGDDELGVFALRGGDVIGDHTVHLLGLGERIELTHRATSRDLFAHGALRAARWLVGKRPARYGLKDVVKS
jgi:4-hydroxy-tetrahydrodipicolinate reductase